MEPDRGNIAPPSLPSGDVPRQQPAGDENNAGRPSNKRPRTEAEEEEHWWNRKEIRDRTRRRTKGVQDAADTAMIEWGDCNPRLPTSGSEGDGSDFLQRLERVSVFANTRANATARLLAELRKAPKLDMLRRIQSELPYLPPDDIYHSTDAESFKDALSRPFQVPLLHRTTESCPSLANNTNFGFREFLAHYSEHEGAPISAYDCRPDRPTEGARQTTVRELLSSFQPGSTGTALDFPAIKNNTGIQFRPAPIALESIVRRLDTQSHRDKGTTEQPEEFFLVSTANAVSPICIDTGAAVTWVLILCGRKIWYFPKHISFHTIRWLAKAGSKTPENYGGWVKVELRPGDLFVMPPSFPFTVFTPENCLAVSGRIYTAAHLGRSLEGLKIQENYPNISNEPLDDSVYNTLSRIISGCGPITTSFEKSQIVTSHYLFSSEDSLAYEHLSKDRLTSTLRSLGIIVPADTKRPDLVGLFARTAGRDPSLSRKNLLMAFWKFYKDFNG